MLLEQTGGDAWVIGERTREGAVVGTGAARGAIVVEDGFFDMVLFGEAENGLGATFESVGDVFAGFGEDF